MTSVLASEGGYQFFTMNGGEWAILFASALTALLAIFVGFILMRGVLAADQGTPKMQEIAGAIQEGAMAYLKRQFQTIIVILIPLAIVVFVTSTAVSKLDQEGNAIGEALSFGVSGGARTFAFVAGAFLSGLTGFIGMSLAVRGNVRTAAAARSGSMPAALSVAFRTGAVAGMFTVGLGLLGATLFIALFQYTSSALLVASAITALIAIGVGFLLMSDVLKPVSYTHLTLPTTERV